jgi:acylphosphatase
MIKRVQAVVTGYVQGVGYRYFAVHVAEQLGLKGCVRNIAGGGVQATAEGDETVLHEFLDALGRGPYASRVDDVSVAWSEPTGEFREFSAVA